MTELKIEDVAPDFTLPTDSDETLTLSDFKGQKVILYFYPKDDTPGCTKESCNFNDNLSQLKQMNTQVIGISKCSVAKHGKFKAKYGFEFPLVSDENDKTCEAYGTWAGKNTFGKTYMGINRTTFLIDENGLIEHIWHKVKVNGHVDDVMKTIKS